MADAWQVTAQRQTERLNAGSTNFESVMEITFEITQGAAQGTVGTIVVPLARYTAETVKELIDAQVEQVNGVAAL